MKFTRAFFFAKLYTNRLTGMEEENMQQVGPRCADKRDSIISSVKLQ